MARKQILVTGATGRQGRALIHALNPAVHVNDATVDSDFHILALTRKASSPSGKSLASYDHVSVVEGNLDSVPSIRRVFEDAKSQGGIWGVFCVLAFPGLGANADGEEAQGKAVANLAFEYGVSMFIFSSVERGGERDDDKAVLDRLAKVKIEKHIQDLGVKGLSWTILRPGFFMENYEGSIGAITVSVLKAGLKHTTTLQLVAVDDIGYVAAGVFRSPEPFQQQILRVVGESCTMKEQEESYKQATGHSISAAPAFIARALISINGHTKGLIEDIERVHKIQLDRAAPEHENQLALAKQAYPAIRNFHAWAKDQAQGKGSKISTRKKGWNELSTAKLASGKQ